MCNNEILALEVTYARYCCTIIGQLYLQASKGCKVAALNVNELHAMDCVC